METLNETKDINELKIIQDGYLKRSDLTPYSDYYGVMWSWDYRKWKAYIKYEGIKHVLGYFTYEHEAAQAYNEKIVDVYGSLVRKFHLYNDNIVDMESILIENHFAGIYYHSSDCTYKPRLFYKSEFFTLGYYKSKLVTILIYNNAVRGLYGYKTSKVHKLNGKEI